MPQTCQRTFNFLDILNKVSVHIPRRNKSATLNIGKTAEGASGRSRIHAGSLSLAWGFIPTLRSAPRTIGRKTNLLVFLLLLSGVLHHRACAQSSWPNQAGDQVIASPVIADLDADGLAEVIVASSSKGVYVWSHDSAVVSGWPQAATHAVLSAVAVGNLDADSELEVVVCTGDLQDVTAGANVNNYVYVYNADGTELSPFPKTLTATRVTSAPTIGDIDDDGSPEILVLAGDKKLYAWDSGGSAVTGYPKDLGGIDDAFGNLILTSSPALADTDSDDDLEVFVGTTGGDLQYVYDAGLSVASPTSSWILGSPAVADIDQDGTPEVVVGSGDGNIYMWKVGATSLALAPGWPKETGGAVYSSPALADIDGNDNGDLEVICGSYDRKIYVLNTDGTLVDGWPRETWGRVLGSPVVADLDGDNLPEIVVGCMGRKVYIWNHDGTEAPGWPKTLPSNIYSSPAVGDLDGDGRLSIVIADFSGRVYEWELSYDTSQSSYNGNWLMFGRNAQHTASLE